MTNILCIGDIVGEPGLAFLEAHLPALIEQHHADLVLANAENLHLEAHPNGSCGMTQAELERLFALGVQLVTGGNHSWDGPEGSTVHTDPRVLRPLNGGTDKAGRGAGIFTSSSGFRLGVVNLAGKSAIATASDPIVALEAQLQIWQLGTPATAVDAVLVDFHGESVFEKITVAYAFAGRIAGLVGTHTHAPTSDARVLAHGTAYISDIGMTGPGGGAQGYEPTSFVESLRSQGEIRLPMQLASGAVELGAVKIELLGSRATQITRINLDA